MRRRTFLASLALAPIGAAAASALPTRPVMAINDIRLTDYEQAKRLYIYWNTKATELMALAPKISYIADEA